MIVGDADLAAHHVDILFDNVQPEPAAFLFVAMRLLHESVKDMPLVKHTNARIGNSEHHLLRRFLPFRRCIHLKRDVDAALELVICGGLFSSKLISMALVGT